ncbi:hypothetical protein FEM48_Zijuj01G0005500 [Ziziphus jujuba var. spinosa]|uniref:Anthocyanidin 3-O-glucosyltransferase 2-like n=1 Tax=Ziziphus jujuba var. spinosa TaxID=714518 RepID=A0A978VY41_ZIZJJ|nr:hypothetical protein FEM48_Zijuj01G0005500 [Ziziphus jujuba var. spinosa]
MSSSRHIAVLAFPFGSHAGPLLSLVRQIAKAVPDVIFSFMTTARSSGIIFSQDYNGGPHNIKPYNVDDGLPDGYVPSGNPVEPVELFVKAAPENFTKALEKVEAETGLKIGCLISDAFFWFAGDMAEKMNVPWVALWTAAPRSVLVHVDTDAIRQALQATNESGKEDQKLDFLPEFSAFQKSDLPEGVDVVGRPESPFEDLLHKMGNKLPQANAVAINSFKELDPEIGKQLNARLKKFLNVGPFTLTSPSSIKPDEHGCLEWLNKHEPNSVVYVSFGSVITPPPHEISALADALEESEFPFLWSFRGVEGGVITKNGAIKAMQHIFLGEGKKMRERLGVLKKLALEAVQPNGSTTRDFSTLVEIINQF